MGRRSILVTIRLDQNKTSRVVDLTHEIEPSDPRLLKAGLRIRDGCLDKLIQALRLHPNVNVNDEHGERLTRLPLRGEARISRECQGCVF